MDQNLDYIKKAGELQNLLEELGFQDEAEAINDCVIGSSTGTEICMALKYQVSRMIENDDIPDLVRKQMEVYVGELGEIVG